MKNDSDYRWDKTGEPDPEIQELEDILGTLRYQPRPLEIPVGLSVGRERNFFRGSAPRLAIAATIAMLLLGLGVWLAFQRLRRTQPLPFVTTAETPAWKSTPTQQPVPKQPQDPNVAAAPKPDETTATPRRQRRYPLSQSLAADNRVRREARRMRERQEAAAAKDQLMLALRVTSAKLSFAQKKTQSINPPEPVHNQHKIG